jgi:hypothetical protein
VLKEIRVFLLLVVAGGAGGLTGSIVGAAFGRSTLFAGGLLGGLVASAGAAVFAGRLTWIEAPAVKGTALGAALGFVAATAVAVNTLSSPWGPILSTGLVGLGGLAGRHLSARARSGPGGV